MARGPYQGTFQPNLRPTVVTAPDAIVYINGEADMISCPVCKKKFDFSKYITSIQVDLNIDSVPGSATVNLSIPRHTIDEFMFDGVPIISPMMEIEIYAKGYYLLEGLPQYYPIFWGIVTEVSDSYSSGEHNVTIQSSDILKWWELCKMNITPAFTGPSGQMGKSLFGNVFFGMNPYDVIFSLAHQAMGDVVIGTGSLTSLSKESAQKATFNAALGDIMVYWNERFGRLRSNLMMYGINGVAVRGEALEQKYPKDTASKGVPVASTAVRNANGKDKNSQLVFDPTSPTVVAFRTQVLNAGTVNFWQSEYQTKLELANAAKEAIGFELYMDVTGDIVFKPPFYNLDILSNKPVSWVQDIDIIDWDFSESEAEVVTQLTIQGNYNANLDYGLNSEELTPYTSVTDYHLLRKYGWRSHTYNSEFMGNPQLMFYHGLDILDRMNAKRHRGSISIPLRPELRLGFPVYVAPKDQIWYLQGISHNIQFGGRATTTLQLTARRGKFLAPKGIGSLKMTGDVTPPKSPKASPKNQDKPKDVKVDTGQKPDKPSVQELARKKFTLEIGKAAQTPAISFDPLNLDSAEAYAPLILRHPKTGRVCGYPNVVMVYTRPFSGATLEQFKSTTGKSKDGHVKQLDPKAREKAEKAINSNLQDRLDSWNDNNIEKLTKAHNDNRWRYGLNTAGVFVYAHETEKVVTQFALLPVKNIEVKSQDKNSGVPKALFESGSAMIRPVSDDRGFEVIGHFRNGRGISLRDGRLTLNPLAEIAPDLNLGLGPKKNLETGIGVQVALTGGLFETLHSQSQGLTTASTVYPNPADALARMQPDDLQTAATITPGKGSETAQFVNTQTNFVDTAPLGSPEAIGAPFSVEASQLSMALTLAEMSVKEDISPDDDCGCSVRADLAFINVGYSVKTLNPANPETNLFNTAGDGGEGVTNFGDEQLRKDIASGGVKPAELKFGDIKSKVEDYLFTLYSAYDDIHQEYEQALRGALLPQTKSEGPVDPNAPRDQQYGDFLPPFSAPNRAALGDPVATALQAKSAVSDIKQKWGEFGKSLSDQNDNFDKAKEVLKLKNELTSLKSTLANLQSLPDGDPRKTSISSVQQEIASKQQKITQLEAEIGIK